MSLSHSEDSKDKDKKVENRHFCDDIIEKLKLFKYKVDEGGLCNGLTYAWNQAVLAKDEKTFFDRLQLIYQTDDIVKKVNDARAKVIEHKALTAEDHAYLDVPAFMEAVSIYQLPEEYEAVFNKELDQKQIEQVSQYTASRVIEQQKGVKEVFNLELLDHNAKEWTTYFDNLREILKTNPNTSVVISTYNHKMGIQYDSKTDSWNLFDQQLVDFPKGISTKNIAHDKIGAEVMDIFRRNEIDNRLMTRIYSTAETLKNNPGIKAAFRKLDTDDVTSKNLFDDKKDAAVAATATATATATAAETKSPKSGATLFQPVASAAAAADTKEVVDVDKDKTPKAAQ